jgi:hypothetical protein
MRVWYTCRTKLTFYHVTTHHMENGPRQEFSREDSASEKREELLAGKVLTLAESVGDLVDSRLREALGRPLLGIDLGDEVRRRIFQETCDILGISEAQRRRALELDEDR